jgi:hypothetical protein
LGVIGLGAAQLQGALAIKSAGSVQKLGGPMQVTVVFTEPVDPTTGAVTANYQLSSGTVSAVTLMTGLPAEGDLGNGANPPGGRVVDNQCAVLEVTGLGTASTTVTVNGVKNKDGSSTLTGGTKTFVPSGYTWCDTGIIAADRKEGKVIAVGDEGFDIFNNGATAWAGRDEFTFVYKEITGDFDYKARVEFADYGSQWSRSGIMVRERTDVGSEPGKFGRYVTMHTDPTRAFDNDAAGVIAGNNTFESNHRDKDWTAEVVSGDHTVFDSDTAGDGGVIPAYPNAWVRLKRETDTITAARYNGNAAPDDITTWDASWPRTSNVDSGVYPAKMLLGAAYCAETGNISLDNGVDKRQRYYLAQIRFTELKTPTVLSFSPSPVGFTYVIQDGQSAVNTGTVKLGLAVDATQPLQTVQPTSVTKVDTTTTVIFAGDVLPNGQHKAYLEFFDNAAVPLKITREDSFTTAYPMLTADLKVSSVTGAGMVAKTYQIDFARPGSDENSTASAELQQARGVLDPDSGQAYPNVAAGSSMDVQTVNWQQGGNDIDATPDDGPDHFNSALPVEGPIANEGIPNIPGTGSDQGHTGTEAGMADNNIVVEVTTYLQLKKGGYRMGVASDDGFKVSIGGGPAGIKLGEYNGGRGTADTLFDFAVLEDGAYPFRLLYWEGTGGADCEWFTVDLKTGERQLVNGAGANAVKAYKSAQGTRAYIAGLIPSSGFNRAETRPVIQATLANGSATTVVGGSAKLILDGQEVATGGTLSLSYQAPVAYDYGTAHSVSVIWTESTTPPTVWTNDYTFSVKPISAQTMPAGSFWIEQEDFDYGKGLANPQKGTDLMDVDKMPYQGGAYDGAGLPTRAVKGIDYDRTAVGPLNNGALAGAGYNYRTDIPAWQDEAALLTDYFVPMNAYTTSPYNERPFRNEDSSIFTVVTSYRTGWSGGGWYNYTRTIPTGIYNVYLSASHWNNTDPATDGQINSTLSRVASGGGTATQTYETLGTFYGPGDGSGGNTVITPLKGADGSLAAIKVNGKATYHLAINAGDTDYIVFTPAANVPATVKELSPAIGGTVNLNQQFKLVTEDFNGKVADASVKLIVDGTDVTAQAQKSRSGDVLTVTYAGPLLAPNGTHSYKFTYTDSVAGNVEKGGEFTTYPVGAQGMFAIEAEDYDYEGGKSVPAASTMPYLGGAYSGLAAVLNVDYFNADANDSDLYRPDQAPNNVDLNDNLGGRYGRSRGLWDVTTNFKIGWAGNTDWGNYTRTVPAGYYDVYAALSASNDDAHGTRASLGLVTAGKGTTNQTVQPVGVFDGPGTRSAPGVDDGWGRNALFPLLTAAGGSQIGVTLNGETTFRFTTDSGDFDYFLLVPGTEVVNPTITSFKKNTDGTLTLEWTGGVLQAAPAVTGPWQDVAGATSPYTITPNQGMLFGRIKK